MRKTDKENESLSEQQSAALDYMYAFLSKNNSPEFFKEFFSCLFTPSELKDFSTRLLLVQEIQKGTTQREIAKKLHISLCKITRGSREFKKPGSAFQKFLGQSDDEQ